MVGIDKCVRAWEGDGVDTRRVGYALQQMRRSGDANVGVEVMN